jgi:hypothetical protein
MSLRVRDVERWLSRLEKAKAVPSWPRPKSADWCAGRADFWASLTDAELEEISILFEGAIERGKMDAYGHAIGPDSEECAAVRAAAARALRRIQGEATP